MHVLICYFVPALLYQTFTIVVIVILLYCIGVLITLLTTKKFWKKQKHGRKDEEDASKQRVRVRVPVPQIGNVDVPPEDGYTWRKYGQKEILHAKYPRYVWLPVV